MYEVSEQTSVDTGELVSAEVDVLELLYLAEYSWIVDGSDLVAGQVKIVQSYQSSKPSWID